MGIEPGPQDLKANTLPRRCKSRLLPQGSRSVLYLPIPTTTSSGNVVEDLNDDVDENVNGDVKWQCG